MKKLIEELNKNNMTINDYYASFCTKGLPVGGALGALINSTGLWYCSVTNDYFYYFKIKNIFSYKGIKQETIKKIPLCDITKVIWKPKTYGYGSFSIEFSNETLSGIFDNQYTGRENFEQILSFMKNECNIPCCSQ